MTLLATEWSLCNECGSNGGATTASNLNSLDNRKLPLPVGGSVHWSNTWFLGPSRVFIQNHMSIGWAVFAQLTIECPITVHAPLYSPKLPLHLGELRPPCNTWYIRHTQVIIPNGIWIGSAIFVWVPNTMLYNALSMEKKTPKLPIPLGILQWRNWGG